MPAPTAHSANSQDPSDLIAGLFDVVRELVVELYPNRSDFIPTLDSTLDHDLGFDSLARVELFSRLDRRFNATLSEEVMVSAETLRDLLRAMRSVVPPSHQRVTDAASSNDLDAVATPAHARTLIDILDWHCRATPGRAHIHLLQSGHEDETVSFQSLRDEAAAVAVTLQEIGIVPGQCVAIMLPTCRAYYASFFGILIAGAIPVPLYPPARPSQIEDHLRRHALILENSRAVALITVQEARRFAQLLRSQTEQLQHVLTVEDLGRGTGSPARPVLSGDDIAFLQYTSGSTGAPKGVVLTHANLLANIRTMGALVEATANDVFVSWLPLYHDMGLIGAWLGSLYHGATLANLTPFSFLTRPRRWFEAIHGYKATLTAGPNFAYGMCVQKIEQADMTGIDLSSLRIAFNGAEPISPSTLNAFCDRFASYGFRREAMMPVYGLAENSLGLTFPQLGRGPRIDRVGRKILMSQGEARPTANPDDAIEFVSCGHVLPGHELRIVDESGRQVSEREEGTLQFRGPSATSGYFRNAAATRRLFQDGWLDSGDRAYLADGEVFISGRTKDMIIRAGRNIYPQELEEAVGNLNGIRKGNVVAFPARPKGADSEHFILLAETRPDRLTDEEQLRRAIKKLSLDLTGAVPDDIVLTTDRVVLKTSSGKVRRAACRELYERRQLGTAPARESWQLVRLAVSSWRSVLARGAQWVKRRMYAIYASVIFAVLGALVWLGVVTLPVQNWRWRFGGGVIRLAAKLCGLRLDIDGLQNLPDPRDKAIYVANHASYLDSFVLVALLPARFSFVAKSEFAASVLLGPFMRRLGTEFVERFDVRRSVADADRLLQRVKGGQSLLYFPEGTFTRDYGLRPFRLGAFMAAGNAGVPVVPLAIQGTRNILRAHSWLIHHGRVRVIVGEPIQPPPKEGVWNRAVDMRNAARAHILRHCGEPDLVSESA